MSAEQQALVTDAINDLPDLMNGTPLEGQPRARALEERMRSLLSGEQAYEMFGVVGPLEPPEGLPLPPGAVAAPGGSEKTR